MNLQAGDRVKYSESALRDKRDYWQANRDSTTAKAWFDEAAARRGTVVSVRVVRYMVVEMVWDDGLRSVCLPETLEKV